MATASRFSVAALQPVLRWRQFMPNLSTLRRQVDALVATNAIDLLVLPESFTGVPAEDGHEPAVEQAVQFLSTLARVCDVAVVGGSVSRRDERGEIRNTCYVVDRGGEPIGAYDKQRLFGHERDTRTPGAASGVFVIDGLRIGVLICADLWDPSLARALHDNVDLVCVPAATVVLSDEHRAYARSSWHQLAMVRALENGFVVAVSDWADGRHESKRAVDGQSISDVRWTSGATCICDPSQRPDLSRMQRTAQRGEDGHVVATIEPGRLASFREYRRRRGLLPPTP